MLEQLLLHIQRHQLCKTTDKILLAVSGGVDSMVMLDLFRKTEFSVGVAHCNFQLRDDDSRADEMLVQRICSLHHIPFYSKRFETAAFAEQNRLSIQLAARQLRYDFFETLARENGYHYIATAHHINDSVETALLNFIRGTGIKGLSGIPVKNERIIRPLLFATRDQILDYAGDNKLAWREDTSNAQDDYQRNFIRHKITPLLNELNPNLEKTFQKTSERVSGAVEMNRLYLENFRAMSVVKKNDGEWINVHDLKKHQHAQVVLWELLKAHGFNYDQCCDIVATTQPGKQFLSGTHRLMIDRDFLILNERNQREIPEILIEPHHATVSNGREEISVSRNTNGKIDIDKDSAMALLDASKITFPLLWRKWQPGDSFRPLGMNTNKKLSDFLIDAKIPSSEKDGITVLESAGRIVWVVGMRISDEVKITASTTVSIVLKVAKTEAEKIS